mmetsp:Transcript_10292/g.35690  ORF Transcript_10292/g.35690 Transcript_10292/m.35690 type:complete len:206 (+) Transcript_10292:112-729(+)
MSGRSLDGLRRAARSWRPSTCSEKEGADLEVIKVFSAGGGGGDGTATSGAGGSRANSARRRCSACSESLERRALSRFSLSFCNKAAALAAASFASKASRFNNSFCCSAASRKRCAASKAAFSFAISAFDFFAGIGAGAFFFNAAIAAKAALRAASASSARRCRLRADRRSRSLKAHRFRNKVCSKTAASILLLCRSLAAERRRRT